MKAKLSYILFTLFSVPFTSLYAQNIPNIMGVVLDSTSKKPISYATVSLASKGGYSIKSTYTKDDGSFTFDKLLPGIYTVSLGALSYATKVIIIDLSASTKLTADLKNVLLSAQNKQLKEVTIKGNKPIVTQEIDRLSYDVQADPENKGLNVLEVMQKVPLLSIDDDDNIRLKGSSDFKIYMNGKPSGAMAGSAAQALRMMRSISVKKIEVITTPSSRYDSEGAAGIINIITTNNVEGYNVIFEIFRTSRLGVLGLGSAFTAKKGKFGINGYAGSYTRTDAPANLFSNTRNSFSNNQSTINDGYSNFPKGNLIPANADLSYEIDSLNLLSSSIVISFNNFHQNDTQSYNTFDQQGNLISAANLNTESNPRLAAIDANLNYQLGFRNKKDRLLTASYQFSTTINDFDSYRTAIGNLNYLTSQLSQQNNAGMKEHTLQLDYYNPGKKINLEAGAKLVKRDNYSDFFTKEVSENGILSNSNEFEYGQNIYSLYNGYQLKFKKWGVYTGLRLERTVIGADFITSSPGVNRNYNNLIPSVIIQRKLENAASLTLGYSQRIQRPGILQLNPFENQVNPLYYTSGNPNLNAVLNNNFDLSYSLIRKATVNIGLNYSFANHTIQNVATLGSDGITRSTFANIGKNDNVGTNVNINYPVTKKLRINFNGRAQYLWLTGTVSGKGYNNEGFSFTTSSNFSYTIPQDWRLRFLLTTTTPVVSLQGQVNGYVGTVMSLNKEFFNKKLGVIFRIDNPTQKYRTTANRLNTSDFMQENRTMKLVRGYYINIYYTIGQLKEKIRKNKRGVTNDDVDKGKTETN
ncbi:hypothetical protein HDC92_004934 [Pedobacter sp. AK017]|uniref:outer membrane beta-barrel family protein n=1 Tax=Pedobacter sp. AK017 TaxID=2723073 RepID=UPI0016111B5C|nr:outer membrane beta-barrel family protein [Pedobacter sp. AK017]MBB5441227.1 hypothetical protein [Pedobacter sp. AK017]